MRPTYAELAMVIEDAATDRAPAMPMLGLVAGAALALGMWGAIAALVWAFVG